jgi:hypothetical protein
MKLKASKIIELQESQKENFVPKLAEGIKEVGAKNVNFQELAWDFFGSDVKQPGYMTRVLRESEGSVVLPGSMSNISAFNATVGGLVNAMVMDAYGNPDMIGDQLVTTKTGTTNGGKAIRVGNDKATGRDDYLQGEAFETVGLTEEYVTVPVNKRKGMVIQIEESTFIYDLTDKVQSAAENAGFIVRYLKEKDILNNVLGITNTYQYNGTSNNTYQTATPWINKLTNALNDYSDISEALTVLWANKNPATNLPLPMMDLGNFKLVVSPAKLMSARAIIRATELRTNTASAVYTTIGGNPLEANIPVLTSQTVKDLIASDVYWHLVNPRAFTYKEIIPFRVTQAPLSSEDVRRGIVAVYVADELGVTFCSEPRYAFQSTGAS